MKKILITTLFIFIILINFFGTSYAALNVTEDSLQKSITKYMDEALEDNPSNNSIKLDKTNKQVLLTSEGKSYIINYDLSSKPKFTIDLCFNSSMTKNECELESEKTSLLMIMFILIADSAGIKFEDSLMYMFSSILENSTTSEAITFTTPIEYAKSLYDDSNNNIITDDLFTLMNVPVSETSDEYKVKANLIINNDKDFSIINGTTDEIVNELSNSLISSVQNTANNLQNSLENDQIVSKPNVSTNKTNNTINKLPQTGRFFNAKDALTLISILTSLLLITIIIKDIKYKKQGD